MSHAIDDTYAFYYENRLRARSDKKCSACAERIAKGHLYWRIVLKFDGAIESLRRCLRCQTLHVHLRSLAAGDMWPDERLNCGLEYEEHWEEEPPEAIAALAFKTQGELQAEAEAFR